MSTPADLGSCLHTIGRRGAIAAILGGAICLAGYTQMPGRFYPAYLTAYMYWLGMSLGCLGLAMMHGLSGGGWGRSIRRVLESGYQTLPLMALLFTPLWLGVGRIYLWTDHEYAHHHESVARKLGYLNVNGFHLRAAIYLIAWVVISLLLNYSSPNEQSSPDSPRSRRLQTTSGLCFIVYALTITLASVDWVMSLEPTWFSTMYGVLYMGGQAVAGLSFSLFVAIGLGRFEPWSRVMTPQRCHDLGNLLLAFVMFWAYVSFMQYLIIWSGNLPEENVWYLHRSHGGWKIVVAALMGLHFAVPFGLLLSREQKRERAGLFRIAIILLVMRYVDLYWLVVPGFDHGTGAPAGLAFHVLDLAAWIAIGGAWVAVFAWRLSARASLPLYDPDLTEAAHERSSHHAT
jgi:hypothetical protein